ncbi:MFS transporter [Bordetella bronchialis]|uniref:MFS transporter n=1 Tax=Bordetella bronchialis TaxID=463025 RepID=UPI0018D275C1|nr:MFS transporter [Bordetella bronchialis]
MLSNSATPLYVHWQEQMGFSSGLLTVIFALYIAGLLGTLLVAGQLSDHYGRKPVLLPGLLAALVACGLFATATSIGMLAAGRLLAGVAVGVIVSAGMAAVLDAGGTEHKRRAALLASVAMVLGAGLGPLLAGWLAQALKQPVMPIFAIEALVLLTALVVAMRLPARRAPAAGPLRLRCRTYLFPIAGKSCAASPPSGRALPPPPSYWRWGRHCWRGCWTCVARCSQAAWPARCSSPRLACSSPCGSGRSPASSLPARRPRCWRWRA